jgi:putative ABC transport system permease protein
MSTWSHDFRLALRTLRRRPGFATMVLATLVLGIGCTTALFGVFRTVFLQPLPLPDSGRLTFIMEQGGFGCCRPASGPDYTDWRDRQRAFSGIGIINPGSVTLTGTGEAERVYATAASASVIALLGVPPLFSRTFTVEEETVPSVVVLSYALCRRSSRPATSFHHRPPPCARRPAGRSGSR